MTADLLPADLLLACDRTSTTLALPFVVDDTVVASNGQLLASAPWRGDLQCVIHDDLRRGVRTLLRIRGTQRFTCATTALRAWAGLIEELCACKGQSICAQCGGTGLNTCFCPRCDDQHNAACDKCEGSGSSCSRCGMGKGILRDIRPALLYGILCNRRLVARALRAIGAVDGEAIVAVAGELDPIRIEAGLGFALVMPIRGGMAAAKSAAFPTPEGGG